MHAELALYRAKADGRRTYRFFTDAMDVEVRARVTLNDELRRAIADEQFFLVYQPQVNIEDGRIVGVEALVRWRHPEQGVVYPDQFIPTAEKGGLIVPLGRWVLREACRQAKAWLDAGIPLPLMAVNMSPAQFRAPVELERDVVAILDQTRLPRGDPSARTDRNDADGDVQQSRLAPGAAAGHGREDLHRRLRHRLFLAGLPASLPGRSDQDRPGVRGRDRRASRGRRHREGLHRPGARVRPADHRRGRRDRRSGPAAGRLGLPGGPGLLLFAAVDGGRGRVRAAARIHPAPDRPLAASARWPDDRHAAAATLQFPRLR